MSSLLLRERDEIDAKMTNDVNMIEMKEKRIDNDKIIENLRAKIILIVELYKFRIKKIMNVLDQLIKTSRVTRTNDVSFVFKSIKTIKKLKKWWHDKKNRKKRKNISKKEQYLNDDCATRSRNDQIWRRREKDVNTLFKKKVKNSD